MSDLTPLPEPDLIYGATLPVDTIDPLTRLWNESSSMVFSRPFIIDAFGNFSPDLIAEYSTSPDSLSYTFTPRSNVTWHDGQEFGAADLVHTFELLSDPSLRGVVKPFLADVVKVVTDGHTVTVTLQKPNPAFIFLLTKACVVPAHRYDRESIKNGGINAEPVGTGPYRVVGREPGSVLFSRHLGYHHGDPSIPTIKMIHIADDDERAAAALAGRVGLAQVKAQHAKQFDGVEGVHAHRIKTRVWRALSFSLGNPILADPRVRRALSMLIDRQEVVDRALGGFGRPQFWPVPPSSWASPDYNPPVGVDAATDLLKSAGWVREDSGGWQKGGLKLAFRFAYLTTETFRAEASKVIAEQFGSIGIPLELVPITWEQYSAMDAHGLRGLDFAGIVVGWSSGIDPYDNLASRYRSDGPYNRDGYVDTELDLLLDQANAERDQTRAKELYRQALEITHRDSIMVPLVNPEYLFAAGSGITGFENFEVDSFYEFTQFAHLFRRDH